MTASGRSRLTWKLEDSPDDASRDEDVGPAWIDGDGSGSYASGPVFGGRWMTRREARAIASEEGFVFFEDDGTAPLPKQAEEARSGLDVAGINRKLRAAGVTESELRVEEQPGREDVKVWGTRLQSLPELTRDSNSPFRTAMVSMGPDKLLEALDELVPGWRSGE